MALSLDDAGQMTGQKPEETPIAKIAEGLNASGQHDTANALLAKVAWINKEAQRAAPGVENPEGRVTVVGDMLTPDFPHKVKPTPHSMSAVQLDRLHAAIREQTGLTPAWEPPYKTRHLKPATTRPKPAQTRRGPIVPIHVAGDPTLETSSYAFCETLPLAPDDRKALQQEFEAHGKSTLKDILLMPLHEFARFHVSPECQRECLSRVAAIEADLKEKGVISFAPVGESDRGR